MTARQKRPTARMITDAGLSAGFASGNGLTLDISTPECEPITLADDSAAAIRYILRADRELPGENALAGGYCPAVLGLIQNRGSMQMKIWIAAIAMSAIAGVCSANDLCSVNPYTKAEAEQGKIAFNSHCALCHQFNMSGREPGNYRNESPDINVLSESDLRFLDHGGGTVPPLVGPKFFKKWDGKSLVDFSSTVSSASNTFPTAKFESPKTYFLLAAYVLYRNCGKM